MRTSYKIIPIQVKSDILSKYCSFCIYTDAVGKGFLTVFKSAIKTKVVELWWNSHINQEIKEKTKKEQGLRNGLFKPFLRPRVWQGQKDLNPRHAVLERLLKVRKPHR